MFFESAFEVLNRIRNDRVVIVGAGEAGTEFAEFLKYEGVSVVSFFDNNPRLIGRHKIGIQILSPKKIDGVKYVISTSALFRSELLDQLQKLGISNEDILIYYDTSRDEDYVLKYDKRGLENAIQVMYRYSFGYDMDWDNPKTYNEKLNWEKSREFNEMKTLCADKFRVRDYVTSKVGTNYLTRIFGNWKSPEEIDFESLPDSYVLKLNNGSGRNIIVRDKKTIDEDEVRESFRKWMSIKWAYLAFEMFYRDIEPVIYCEELLEGVHEDDFCDYKVFCFHGKVKYIQRIRFEHTDDAVALFYDKKWVQQPFNQYYKYDIEVEKPWFIDEIVSASEKLAADFKHVRVDWFVTPKEKVYFGEMTFCNWAGQQRFIPEEYDRIWGDLI